MGSTKEFGEYSGEVPAVDILLLPQWIHEGYVRMRATKTSSLLEKAALIHILNNARTRLRYW